MPTAVNNVITITTAEQLAAFAKAVNGGNNYSGVTIKLGADLDLNGDNYSWTPIGNGNYTFKGTFDGDGHTISNLKINSNAGYIGLFGCVDGTIQNVNLNNVNVSSSGPEYVGGLVARTHHNGNTKIENCTVSGTVSGTGNYTWNVGEIASNNSGTVSNCTFNGTVSGISSVGGLFGANFGNISNCTVIATVSGMSGVGGISGENFCNINGNTAIVTVNGTGNAEHLGGISGTNKQTTVTSGTISGTVSGNYYYSNRSKAVDYIGPNAENVSDNTQLYKLTLPSGVEATATGTGNKVVADNGNYYAAGTVTLKASDSTAVIKSTSYTNNDDGTVSLTPTADTNISSNDIAFYYKLTLQGVTVDSGTGYGGNYSDYYTGTVTLAAKTGYNLSQTSLTVTKAETITATLASGVYVFSTDDGATYQLATADNVKSNNYPDLQQAYQLTLPSGVTAANGVIIADGNYYMIPNSEVTLTIGTGAALVDVTGYSNVAANSSGTVPFKPTADVTINANNLYYAVSGLNNITASGGTYTTVNGTTYYAANSSVTLSSNVNGAIIGAATATGGKLNDNGDGTWTLTTTSAASTVTPTLYYSVNGIDGLNVTGGTSKTVSGTNYYKSGSSVTLSSNVNGAIIGAATATGGKLNDNGDGTWTLTTTSAASTVTPTLYYAVSGLNNVTASGGTSKTVNGTTYYKSGSSVTLTAGTGAIIGAATASGGSVTVNDNGTATLTTTSAASTVTPTLYYSVSGLNNVTASGGTSKTVNGTNYYAANSSVTLSSNVNGAIIGAATASGGSVTVNDNGTATLKTTSSAATVTPTLYYSVSGLDNVTASGGTSKTVNGTNYYAANSSVTLSSNVNGAIIGAATASGGSVTVNDNGTATLTTTSSAATVTPTLYYSVTVPSGVSVSGNTSKTVDGTTYYAGTVTLSATDDNAVIRSTSYTNNDNGTVSFTPAAATDFSNDLTFYYAVNVPNCVDSVSGTSIDISGTNYYQSGSTLTFTPKTGYVVNNVTVSSDTSITATVADGHYAFSNGDGYTYATNSNVAENNYPDLTRVYAINLPDAVAVSGDKVATDDDGNTYAVDSVTLSAAEGYTLQNVKVDGKELTDNFTFTVNAETTVLADCINFNNTNISKATGAQIGGTTGNLSTFNGVYSISASQDDSTLTSNGKNNTFVLTGGGENILTGGQGNDTYKFESGGGIVTDYGIGSTKDSTGKTLSAPLGSDIIKLGGKVSGVYFDRDASTKKSPTFTAVITYDSDDVQGDDTQIIVLQNINKKPTKYGSNPVYQTNDAAAATLKIWDTSGTKQAVLSASKLKKLFHDDSDLSELSSTVQTQLVKLNGIGDLNLPAVDRLSPSNTQATYSGSND